MKIFKLLSYLCLLGVLITSCEKEEMNSVEEEAEIQETPEKVSKEIISKIADLSFNIQDVQYHTFDLPDGSSKTSLLLEGDILLDPEHLDKWSTANATDKQYRTYNLVYSPRNVNVIGYTGGAGQGLTTKQRTALQRAINNFNDLNIGLNFTLTFGTNYSSYDIVVYQNPNGQAGGVAGFPSGGDPYQYVQIYSGMENYSTAVNEHVITHEIGHTVGMRHTDWFSRQSCGQNTNEGTEPYGAVHIPGTPTGYDSGSLMLSCFNTSVSGNFGYYDIVALEYLY